MYTNKKLCGQKRQHSKLQILTKLAYYQNINTNVSSVIIKDLG